MFTHRIVLTLLALPIILRLSNNDRHTEQETPASSAFESLCAARDADGRIRAWKCDEEFPLFYAPNDVRAALGEPLCWWHASRDDLDELPRMSDGMAKAVYALRLSGVAPDPTILVGASGVGPSRADALGASLTTDCAYIPIDARPATPIEP